MNEKLSFICPFCGAQVPQGALACPECGSDEQTGWSDDLYGLRPEAAREKPNPIFRNIRIAFSIITVTVFIIVLLNARMAVSLLPFLAAAVLLLILVKIISGRTKAARGPDGYARLLSRAGGDKELAGRLINFEKQRNPFRTRKQLLADALERLEKDNR